MRGQPLLPARRGWGKAAPARGSPAEAEGACPAPFSSLPTPAERLLPGRAAPWLRLALVPTGGRGALAAAERPLAAAAAAAPPLQLAIKVAARSRRPHSRRAPRQGSCPGPSRPLPARPAPHSSGGRSPTPPPAPRAPTDCGATDTRGAAAPCQPAPGRRAAARPGQGLQEGLPPQGLPPARRHALTPSAAVPAASSWLRPRSAEVL